jgi:hypothetical protein
MTGLDILQSILTVRLIQNLLINQEQDKNTHVLVVQESLLNWQDVNQVSGSLFFKQSVY